MFPADGLEEEVPGSVALFLRRSVLLWKWCCCFGVWLLVCSVLHWAELIDYSVCADAGRCKTRWQKSLRSLWLDKKCEPVIEELSGRKSLKTESWTFCSVWPQTTTITTITTTAAAAAAAENPTSTFLINYISERVDIWQKSNWVWLYLLVVCRKEESGPDTDGIFYVVSRFCIKVNK